MMAEEPIWKGDPALTAEEPKVVRLVPKDDTRPAAYSDDALALRFVEQHGDDLRFVAPWNQWLCWTGTHWLAEETLKAFDLARTVCRDAAKGVPAKLRKLAAAVASAKTVAAVERLAKADRKIAATLDQWDTGDWWLNTPGGIVDLKAGELHPHRREDYCTKITAVTPEGECPKWTGFLARITGDAPELQAYLQRVAGYSLTGITREHALFDGYGTGRNGKSVFQSTIAGVIGTYATTAPIETFTATSHDHHPTELARLNGARLVTASETEEGRAWAESKIKALTGGDKIAARYMRADFFEFIPKFKLFVVGNHKPRLRTVDEAIRRRLHLIPFAVTIPASECDPLLFEKLREEWPGILAWMIQGCLLWQRDGLNPPAVVRDATAEYLDTQDATQQWLDDRCKISPMGFATHAELFRSWGDWATKAGETIGSQRRLIDAVEARGFTKARDGTTKNSRGFRGLYVIPRPVEGNDQ
jgi:putative DNA primase/helicase